VKEPTVFPEFDFRLPTLYLILPPLFYFDSFPLGTFPFSLDRRSLPGEKSVHHEVKYVSPPQFSFQPVIKATFILSTPSVSQFPPFFAGPLHGGTRLRDVSPVCYGTSDRGPLVLPNTSRHTFYSFSPLGLSSFKYTFP